ncbi:ankyrin repeat domain-containing protein [Lusitaniella coriacea LEGE 07157]|uniref:Ankyrin repeat domain-containing protein n=1 Tax=Lusitaniella coriacea LEGE 07157 TaxID=945747 RepID=A0A8J7E220_9CYAN|nr:ankyrin repeat domain-containing protein [Lusitaniella coriacea LEGE 07157]
MLEAGSSVNLENSSDITSLMTASLRGRLDFVQALVSSGADVNYINHDGQTALKLAAYNGHQEVFDYLFPLTVESERKNYAKQILPDGIRRKERRQNKLIRNLISAVTEGDIEAIRETAKGTNINAFDEDGVTALHTAVLTGQVEIIRTLLALGANPNILAEDDGWTPLMEAAQAGYADVVNLLIEAGAELENCIEDMTPLMLAADSNALKVAEISIEAGANVNVKNRDGRTALFFAQQGGHTEIIQLLLDSGATEE